MTQDSACDGIHLVREKHMRPAAAKVVAQNQREIVECLQGQATDGVRR